MGKTRNPVNKFFCKICLCFPFVLIIGLNSNCTPPVELEKRAEDNRQTKQKCDRELEWFRGIYQNIDEYSRLLQQAKLSGHPYIKSKILVLKRRHSAKKFELDSLDGYFLSEVCKNYRDSHPSNVKYGSEDPLHDIRARSGEELQTLVFLDCNSAGSKIYRKEGSVLPVPGLEEACEMSLVDKTIPAVIFKKSFYSEKLSSVETANSGDFGVSKKVDSSQINQFLLNLPRR